MCCKTGESVLFIVGAFPPLLSELAVLLPVRGAQAEQRLQTVPAGLYILIVYIHVVQVLLLLEDLLSRA